MGEIVNIHCKSCESDWECKTGIGIMHGSLKSIAGLFPAEQKEEIEGYAAQTPPPQYSFSFRAARCKHCCGIVSIPVLILTETGTTFIPPCPVCGAKPKPIVRLSGSTCPLCGKPELESEITGRWD